MTLRGLISGSAVFTAVLVGLAAVLAAEEMSAYPVLDNLDSSGWLAISAGIVAVLTIPGFLIYGLAVVLIRLPDFFVRTVLNSSAEKEESR